MYKKLFLIFTFAHTVFTADFSELKRRHKLQNLNEQQITYLAGLSNPGYTDTVLDNILIPRVVGTQNHDKVHDYIIGQLKQLGYTVEIDAFEEQTPNMGQLKFRNILGTLNPNAERYLVLSCHYDSKYFKDEVFVGATDSAVPCAMMLNLAKVMQKELEQSKSNNDVSLLLVFLDGEEAFLRWAPDDSIYGARHLAQKWEKHVSNARSGQSVNLLQRIDAFVLLDLLGTPNPTFFSYFPNTERLYVRLANAEDRLSEQKLLKHSRKSQRYFRRRSTPSYVEDDHIPFLIRGVPILHIIPKQFPKVWHKPEDNRDAIDMETVEDLNKILRVFVAEYLHAPVQYLKTDVDQSKALPHEDEL